VRWLRLAYCPLPPLVFAPPLADLNGLVLFAERRDLVSARVPSRFKSSLTLVIPRGVNTLLFLEPNICTSLTYKNSKVPSFQVFTVHF